ncbi:LHFPL tetraspan subfamily member 2 protein-like [Oppia nitens]|uniref:LHFPL tetraspan subfamily member 2 protein-like n=1 Tax=Oppia nitens TaxID=1686743 RepID=UPI0023DBCAF7|nr:LHFPL tetraspan subfamily member 2 protein-like [Oppia nitens]
MCCYVIVTARTLIWTLLSIVATLCMLAAIWTPIWLVGPPKRLNRQMTAKLSQTLQHNKNHNNSYNNNNNNNILDLSFLNINNNNDNINEFMPSLGIFNRCTRIYQLNRLQTECAPFVTGLDQENNSFPNAWKASIIFYGIGISIMTLTIVTSLLGCCKRSICRKSIFTISGTIQAVAGLFYILAIFSYPFGWGTDRVERVCGVRADPFLLGDCSIGWALYLAVGSTVATFICAILSIQAEISTSSDKVQDEILDGKNLICLL